LCSRKKKTHKIQVEVSLNARVFTKREIPGKVDIVRIQFMVGYTVFRDVRGMEGVGWISGGRKKTLMSPFFSFFSFFFFFFSARSERGVS